MMHIPRLSTAQQFAADQGRMRRIEAESAQSQTRIATGQRLSRPSDDPGAAARIALLDRQLADSTQDMRTIDHLSARWSRIDQSLGAMAIPLQRVQEILLLASSDNHAPSDRQTMATELSGLVDQLFAEMARVDADGMPLHAGSTARPPYVKGATGAIQPTGDSAGPVIALRDGAQLATGLHLPDLIGPRDPLDPASDLFGSLEGAQAALVSGQASADVLAPFLSRIQTFTATLADGQAQAGSILGRLDMLREAHNARQLDLKTERAPLADTDVGAEIVKVQQAAMILDASRSLFARVRATSLFDFLR